MAIELGNQKRRNAVKLLASLLLSGVPGCAFSAKREVTCVNDARISDIKASLTIDTHAHIFNGNDLQISAFLNKVALRKSSEMSGFALAVGPLLQGLGWHLAPNSRQELAMLDKLADDLRKCDATDLRHAFDQSKQDGYQLAQREMKRTASEYRARQATRFAPEVATDPYAAVHQRIADEMIHLPDSLHDYKMQQETKANAAQASPAACPADTITGYIDFVIHHFHYRYVNACEYLTTYSSDSPRKVDLVTACMVDYDYWLNGGKATPATLPEQIEVMARVSQATAGRVHGFVPFCPFREAATAGASSDGDALKWVKTAIEKFGFIGIKMYPPMGFAAYGNGSLQDYWQVERGLPSIAYEKDFGLRLDRALDNLYRYCIANGVPIMAHTNQSNGPNDQFEKLAGAEYWTKAITKHPGLRVSFGHFGNTDPVNGGIDRPRAFMQLMASADGANAFADSAYFGDILDDRVQLTQLLAALYRESLPNGANPLRRRLMYGTDWEMILTTGKSKKYLANFIQTFAQLEQRLGNPVASWAGLSDEFFGKNAARFLGLWKMEPNRVRLERFYKSRNMLVPDWMIKIDKS